MDVFEVTIIMFFADERDIVRHHVGLYPTLAKALQSQHAWMEVSENKEWAESALTFQFNVADKKLGNADY